MVEISYEEDGLLTLSTLGALAAISQATKIDASRGNGFRVSKVNIAAQVEGKTAAEGPLIWGLSANMTAAQVKAAIEADPQNRTADNVRGAGQWLKFLGVIGLNQTEGALTGPAGGIPSSASMQFMEVPVNWSVIEGQNFQLFVYNTFGSALTTGTLIRFYMEIFGVWLRD